jgi:hypothetical protein
VNAVFSYGVQADIKPSQITFIALNFSKNLLLPHLKLISVNGVENAREI